MTIRRTYERFLWQSIALVGADGSIERKMLTAVGLQFLGAVAMAILAVFTTGIVQIAGVGATLALSAIAFGNTYLVAERDLVEPIVALDAAATDVAAGEFEDVEIPDSDRHDEIAGLVASFEDMQENLGTAARQADALARQDFDDPALDNEVPGAFGNSIAEMAVSLEAYTRELETKTDELQAQSGQLQRLVDALSEAVEDAQDGDLTATVDAAELDVGEDHRAVAADVENLVATLADTIADIQSFADEVLSAARATDERVADVADNSAEVSGSVNEIAAGAAQQTEQLNDIAAEMDTLSASVQEIAASADDVADTAQSAADRGEAGREAVEETISELRDLREQSQAVAETVASLAEAVDRIDGITAVIEDIAEETNMLALNASIEAARTDGEGDGFAVVAEEVKSLAGETSEQASDISQLVAEVTDQADEATAAIDDVNTEVDRKIENAEDVLRDFEAIVDEVANVNAAVQEISTATEQGAQSTTEVARMVDEVGSVSQETAAEAETVATAADDQTQATDDVADRMTGLAQRTEALADLLDDFDVPVDAGTGVDLGVGVEDAAGDPPGGGEPRPTAGDVSDEPAVTDGGDERDSEAFDWQR
jgi:methyl-accepting chemotaxis protein